MIVVIIILILIIDIDIDNLKYYFKISDRRLKEKVLKYSGTMDVFFMLIFTLLTSQISSN